MATSSNNDLPLFGSPIVNSSIRSNPLFGPASLLRNQTIKASNPNRLNQSFTTLPPEQLLFLIESLSNDLDLSKRLCSQRDRELEALKVLCFDNGIGEEEIDRTLSQVIQLDEVVDELESEEGSTVNRIRGKRRESDQGNTEVESLFDLDGLTEAITENAFDFSQSGFTSDEESSSKLSNTFTLDTRHPSSKLNDSHPSKSQQPRHTSLSSRLFSTSALFYNSTSPTSTNSASSPTIPPSISPVPIIAKSSTSNRSRSDSVKSVASSISIPASVESNLIVATSGSKSNGYGEWIGWKGWSKGEKSKKGFVKSAEVEVEQDRESGDTEDQSSDSLPAATSTLSENTVPTVEEVSSDISSTSPTTSSLDARSQTKLKSPSLLSTTTTTSPSSSQMFSKGRCPSDTILTPPLAPTVLSLSSPSVTPYSVQPHMIQPEEKIFPSKSRRTSLQPNLTLFPKLSSLSKYSPFAQPALATPSPQVSLSSHPSSPVIPTIPLLSTITTSSTMELDVIPIDSRPSFTSQSSTSKKPLGTATEPLIDRYGFVYDVRSGMKLLREARGREERRLAGGISEAEDEEETGELVPSPEEEVLQNRLDVESQIADLSKSLGLPTVSSTTSASQISIDNPPTAVSSSSPALAPPPKSSRLIRTLSAESTASTSTGGTQSMKRLLNQLTEMHNGVERVQREAWDTFIHRRQLILANEQPNSDTLGGKKNKSKSKSLSNKKEKKVKSLSEIDNPLVDGSGGISNTGDEETGELDIAAGWNENLVGVAQMGSSWKTGKEDWQEFKALVKKGIPIAHRPKIWAECSGANEVREPGSYQELLDAHQGEKNQCLNQIDMDCHRTFPTNVFFAGNGPGVAKLRNILVAYSGRNPTIGYCQGMNNLTATLLLVYSSEEDAFWVLVCLIEKILPSDYYTSQLLVSQADQRVLQSLVSRHLPEVAAHFEEIGVELPAITFGWFLSIFTDTVPVQTLLRIWDLLFVWGTVILFRIAFAILQMHSAEILECDSAASLYALMRGLTTHLYQVDKLISVACDDLRSTIKDKEVESLRSIHVEALRTEMEVNLAI